MYDSLTYNNAFPKIMVDYASYFVECNWKPYDVNSVTQHKYETERIKTLISRDIFLWITGKSPVERESGAISIEPRNDTKAYATINPITNEKADYNKKISWAKWKQQIQQNFI